VRNKLLSGLSGIVNFTPLPTDKFYLADTMTKAGKKLLPRWISGINRDFNGTMKQLVEKIPGQPRLYIVIERYGDEARFLPRPLSSSPPRLEIGSLEPVVLGSLVQRSLVQRSPVQISPVQISSVQRSPVQRSPV
jgi:hypothetical protein